MNIIEISHVTKTFGKNIALDDVTLEIDAGEIFGFLGPNGAGKSTTIRCLMGYIFPNSGNITVKGLPVDRSHAKYREHIGYVPSDLQLNQNWTGEQHIEFLREARSIRSSIDNEIARLSFDPSEKVKHLSTGNKQKLAFLLALMTRPDILILDEPTKGLDPLLQEVMYEMLMEFKGEGGCVFFSSHNLAEVERLCDRIGIIRSGKIVANETMDSLRQKNVHIVTVISKANENLPDLSSFGKIMSHSDRSVRLRIDGDINLFLREVAKYEVSDVSIEHANLEDVFMHFYEDKK
ncbi:MAG TPA: ABC transporter ATP-binding protein [Acidimicrobiia bacterium]|nr:ABC transporter ATP-binding protein [Acidimicrobiia bacterium]